MSEQPKRVTLTVEQKRELADLLHTAFVFLRSPGYRYFWRSKEDWNDVKKLQEAVDRAVGYGEAFHNLPNFLFMNDGFVFEYLERDIKHHLPEDESAGFLSRLLEIKGMRSAENA